MGHSLIIRHLCPPPTVVSVCSPNQPSSQSGRTDCTEFCLFICTDCLSVCLCCDSLAGVWEEIHVRLKTLSFVPGISVIVMMKAHVSFLYELCDCGSLGRPLPCVWIQLQKYIKYPRKAFDSTVCLYYGPFCWLQCARVNVTKPLEGFRQVGHLSLNIFVLLDLSDFSRYIHTLRFV